MLTISFTDRMPLHSPVQVSYYVFERGGVGWREIFEQLSEFLYKVEHLGVRLLSLIQQLRALRTVSSVRALGVQTLLGQPH